jgi:hypothetical protein
MSSIGMTGTVADGLGEGLSAGAVDAAVAGLLEASGFASPGGFAVEHPMGSRINALMTDKMHFLIIILSSGSNKM